MADIGRRGFVKGATLGALAFTVGGVEVIMAASDARARGVPFRLLDAHQGETLEALGETLVPQARESGIAALHRSAAFGAGQRIPAAGPHLQLPSAVRGFLPRHHQDGRWRQQQDVRQGFRATCRPPSSGNSST